MGQAIATGKGRRWLEGGHPWLYADDLADVACTPGELVPVFAPDERPLGWGLASTHSRIAVRMVTREARQPDRAFWLGLVRGAVERRAALGLLAPKGACRLLAGDAERLPGLVVDRYGSQLVVQSGCQGSDRMRDFLLELVRECLPVEVTAVLDRSDSSVRKLEALEPRVEWVGAEGERTVAVEEGELAFEVDLLEGHKTGAYLDQRDNRVRAARDASGRRVLDAFSYDGLFGIRAALAGAAEVVCLDQNAAAGERLARNAERNGVADRVRFERANAMHALRDLADAGERFGVVVVDPPAFARNRKEAAGAARGYRELNRRAFQLLEPGGLLVTASCSHNVSREAFLGHVRDAARDAGREGLLEAYEGAAPDHPHRLALPESAYLKCAFVRVV